MPLVGLSVILTQERISELENWSIEITKKGEKVNKRTKSRGKNHRKEHRIAVEQYQQL